MTTNRTVTTTVQYQVNQASLAAVQQANQQVVSSMQTIPAAASEVVTVTGMLNASFEKIATSQAFSKLAQDVASGAISFQEMAQAAANLGATEPEISKLAQDITNIQNAQASATSGGAGSGGGINLGGARGGLRAAGFLLGAEAGGGALRAAGQVVTLGSAFGIAGVAAAALAVGMRAVTASQEAATKAAQAYSDALKGSGAQTTEDVKKSITDLQLQRTALEGGRKTIQDYQSTIGDISTAYSRGLIGVDEYNTNLKNLNAEIYDATGGAIGMKDGLGQAVSNIGDFNGALSNNQDAINEVNGKIGLNTSLLGTDALAFNDHARAVAEANKRIDDSQLELARASADAQTMTADARAKEADSIRAHITALEESIEDYNITGAALDAVNAEINSLDNRLAAVTDTTHSWADTLADIAQRADAVNNLFDALTKEGEAEQKVAQARQDVADAASDHADKLREIATDEANKEAADRAEAAKQAEEDQAKHLQKLADIDKQYAVDHETAVGNRDALANYQAAQKRDEATTKENETYALQEQQLAAHLDEQLAQDRAAQQKQIDAENASYRKREAQLIQALNNAQVEQSRAAGLALAYQRQANDAQLNERIRANNSVQQANVWSNALIEAANEVHHQSMLLTADSYGGAIVTSFTGTMGALLAGVNNFTAGLLANPFFGAHASASPGSNGGLPGLNFSMSADSFVRGIVNNQIVRMQKEAYR